MAVKKKVIVFCVDDHPIFSFGLQTLLSSLPWVQKAVAFTGGAAALQHLQTEIPAVVFMDVRMPGMDGVECTKRMLEQNKNIKIIGMSTYTDRTTVLRMCNAGASAFVSKSIVEPELSYCVETVLNGASYFDAPVGAAMYAHTAAQVKKGVVHGYTDREREIYQLLYEELTTKEMAARMGLAESTVNTHRMRMMKKTKSRSLAGLIKYAISNGIITP